MSEVAEDCEECKSKKVLEKLPSRFTTNAESKEKKTGDIVKSSIREIKNELQQQKEELSNEFYRTDK
jgi:gas vesicle protein